jgi:hypothetical protein
MFLMYNNSMKKTYVHHNANDADFTLNNILDISNQGFWRNEKCACAADTERKSDVDITGWSSGTAFQLFGSICHAYVAVHQ